MPRDFGRRGLWGPKAQDDPSGDVLKIGSGKGGRGRLGGHDGGGREARRTQRLRGLVRDVARGTRHIV